ncbi:hypothetical protein GCM10008959_25970 [Deinococcus seoulensis]|uniref:MarR family transcriptional regulator n=1 Tax=Deinococcus seoulensis TaxID=1837379 RepID=A0ABQ2RVE0_9DEIO|nr:hypothetical protein [Deinococcus seoulensis]GGR62733.1 hypothetical protein GCM10008959_25970 [Deinococcus seoulensis]
MTAPLNPAAPETAGRGHMILRVAHANAGQWITVTQLRELLGMEGTGNYAKQAAYQHRTGLLDRQHAPDHRPDRPRFEYRFRAWPPTRTARETRELEAGTDASEAARRARQRDTTARRRVTVTAAAAQILTVLRAAPEPLPELTILGAVPTLSVTAAREALAYLVHETQEALLITPTTMRSRVTTYAAVRSGLPRVPARPLTPDAEAVQGLLSAATERDSSLSRQALMEQTRWPWPRVEKALSLLEAHHLLALRPVGASILFRHAPTPERHKKVA